MAAPALAATPGPGFAIDSVAAPTDFPLSATQVQRLAVDAEKGTYTLSASEVETAPLPSTASAAELQVALEALPAIGAGNVTVTGGPGDPSASKPYVITSTGTHVLTAVPTLTANSSLLEGAGHTATVTVTTLGTAGGGTYDLEITNVGSTPTAEGQPIVITDTVSAPLTPSPPSGPGECTVSGQTGRCVFEGVLQPDQTLHYSMGVSVNEPVEAPVSSTVTVSGGGAREASLKRENLISPADAPFGVTALSAEVFGLDGRLDSQAGGHPYEFRTTIDLNDARSESRELKAVYTGVQDLRDVVTDLPLGFVGSTLAAPQCTLAQLSSISLKEGTGGCPPETVVGHLTTEPEGTESANSPIWNLTPEKGVPAEFGYVDGESNTHVFYAHVVPTEQGYVLQVTSKEIPQIILDHIVVTFYGDPAARAHLGSAQIPFFTNPSACQGEPLTATIWVDSWQHPGRVLPDGAIDTTDPNWVRASATDPPVSGCDELSFEPKLFAQPTTEEADSPSGLRFGLEVPQTENVQVSATPDLDNALVNFPQGMTVDPSSGTGLQACSVAQIGWLGPSPFNFSPSRPECPEASKIGTLELETPLVRGTLHGEIYLAAPNENPFGSVFAIYVVVDDPTTGVVLKIPGELKLDPTTGQISSRFPENAQLPFSALKLEFFGGPRAELATPESCGTFTTTSDLEPWSAKESGPNANPFSSFNVSSGCVGGFKPAFTAGTTNLQAGAYTSFVASFSRQDNDQELSGLSVTLPEGMLANVGSVPECGEAEIAAARAGTGGCPQDSRVGTVTAFAGPGPNPLQATGTAYWTGPYNGGPFGIAVVVPAIAGPFNFGNVVVRQSLRIDPTTAKATDVSDPFPTFLDPRGANGQANGVPIKLKRIDVDINGAGGDLNHFTFNGTSCEHLEVTASLTSVANETAPLSSPYQLSNCEKLKFAPTISASASGKTSKADGASLTYRVSYPKVPQGTDADIQYVKVELPSELPSRLTTLQKACTAAQFDSNPAGCPAPSVIGHAVVHTQILPAPLEGPVYFVSNGGEAFPNLVMVLQGDNVKIDLVGDTLIKNGVTSTTFKTVPDTPFETFEINLPEGKYSALAANANLCKPTVSKTVTKKVKVQVNGRMRTVTRKVKEQVATSLTIPSDYIAQNGATLKQSTKITVTGCKSSKPARHSKKGKKGGKGKKN